MNLVEYVEGYTKLLVPKESLEARSVPPKKPAFFNPQAKPTRDVAVLFYDALYRIKGEKIVLLDLLSGIGARGIRVAVETSAVKKVYLNDVNSVAARVAALNCSLNRLKDLCAVTTMEARHLLYSSMRRNMGVTAIDIDPFGSPVVFIDAAISALPNGGVIALTATDTSALSGKAKESGRRKYFARLSKVDFPMELAVRVLLASLAQRAAAMEKAIIPLFAHATSQYIRVYAEIRRGATIADKSLSNIGYIAYCPRCSWKEEYELGRRAICPHCGHDMTIIGPLWLGPVFEQELVRLMINGSEKRGWSSYARILERALGEAGMPPYHYSVTAIADSMNVCVPKPDDIVKALVARGHKASRTSFEPTGVKTDAPPSVVKSVIVELSSCR